MQEHVLFVITGEFFEFFYIPVNVYHSLINNVNKIYRFFHRYLALRKRMLGLDTLKYSDMYTEVVKGVDLKYTYDEAQKLIMNR